MLFYSLQFMGKWYQVAVVSTCTFYMKRKSRNPEMVPMVLHHVDSELNFTKTATSFRSDRHGLEILVEAGLSLRLARV